MNYDMLEQAVKVIRNEWPDARPFCGLILGSGWGDVAKAFAVRDSISYEVIPGLGKPGVEGHGGHLIRADHAGLTTFVFQGRRHWYEGEGWTPIALPIYVLSKLGASVVVITNAAGGIRPGLVPGSLMAIDDHINFMGTHLLVGAHNAAWGPRFPDQTRVYDPRLRLLLDRAAAATAVEVHHGIYLAASGPTYETPAEIRAFRELGADAVGMSTAPEATLANAAGLRVLGLSCISNFAAGMSDGTLSHEEVAATTKKAMPRMKKLLLRLWEEMGEELAGKEAR